MHHHRWGFTQHGIARDDHTLDGIIRGNVKHDGSEDLFQDGPEPSGAGLALGGEIGNLFESLLLELELDAIQDKHALILLDESVLGARQDVNQR